MYNLAKIAGVIDRYSTKKAADAIDIADYEPAFVSNIVVKPIKDGIVNIYVDNELVEVGISLNNRYDVKIFRDAPYPYEMYPLLRIKCESAFVIDFNYHEYDVLLSQAIFHLGVYYQVLRDKFILMKGDCISVGFSKKDEIELKRTSVDDTSVVIECMDFHKVSESVLFSWIKPFIIPGAGNKYLMMSYLELGVEPMIPCVIVEKNYVPTILSELKKHYTKLAFTIADRRPSEVIKNNNDMMKRLLKHLRKKHS